MPLTEISIICEKMLPRFFPAFHVVTVIKSAITHLRFLMSTEFPDKNT